MQMPNVDNWIIDQERNVRYNVKAYRKLSRSEIVTAVRISTGRTKRKPKKNSTVTIVTIIGHHD